MSQNILCCFIFVVIVQIIAEPIGRPYSLITEQHFVQVGGCIGKYNVYEYTELFVEVCERCDAKFEVPTDGSPRISLECANACFKNEYFKGCLNELGYNENKQKELDVIVNAFNTKQVDGKKEKTSCPQIYPDDAIKGMIKTLIYEGKSLRQDPTLRPFIYKTLHQQRLCKQ